LTFLIIATFSRSTWIATFIALSLLTFVQLRRTKLPLLLAVAVLSMTVGPISAAMTPVVGQVSRGEPPTTLRTKEPETPPPNLRDLTEALPSALPSPGVAGDATSPPEMSSQPDVVSPLDTVVTRANSLASERNGATDRIALDVLAVRLWLQSWSTALAGIGLGVFLAITPFTSFALPTVLHNTYLWLPVEMGLPGLATSIALVLSALWILRGASTKPLDDFAVIAIGGTALFGVWLGLNEGLYQRTLWLLFGLLSTAIAPPILRRASMVTRNEDAIT
jgi:hypothetical protein